MSLAPLRFGRVEFRISNNCFDFFKCACLKKTTTNIPNSTRPNWWATKDIRYAYYVNLMPAVEIIMRKQARKGFQPLSAM